MMIDSFRVALRAAISYQQSAFSFWRNGLEELSLAAGWLMAGG